MDKWTEYRPIVGENKVLTYKKAYRTFRPYFGVPNIFHRAVDKWRGIDELTGYINNSSIIEYTYVGAQPAVTFTPNISKKYKAKQYKFERWWAQDYVVRMLRLVGLKPVLVSDNVPVPFAYVALDDAQNLKQMRRLATYFAFEQNRMLTREIVKQLSRNAR